MGRRVDQKTLPVRICFVECIHFFFATLERRPNIKCCLHRRAYQLDTPVILLRSKANHERREFRRTLVFLPANRLSLYCVASNESNENKQKSSTVTCEYMDCGASTLGSNYVFIELHPFTPRTSCIMAHSNCAIGPSSQVEEKTAHLEGRMP